MTIYAKTTKELILDWASENVRAGAPFPTEAVVAWFSIHYPLSNPKTVSMHLEGMSINNGPWRAHHQHIRPDTNWDHFFKLGSKMYRLYDPRSDPKPEYG